MHTQSIASSGASLILGFLEGQRENIARQWIDDVKKHSRSLSTVAEIEHELRPIFDALLAVANQGYVQTNSPSFSELQALLEEYSRTRARQGFTPSETVMVFFLFRNIIFASVQGHGEALYAEFLPFAKFIDDIGLVTFEAFAQTREEIIANQSEQLLELSTPVVKLWEGILAVPLVGTLDSIRTQVVMESLLQALVTTGSEHAIIDITGVLAVDTQVAQHLLKTVFAARLMGAECIISGIRPQIAQTIVSLGIEFGDIATKATLADALRLTLQRAGLEVRKASRS